MKIFFTILFLITLPFLIKAQNNKYTTQSIQAIKYYEKAGRSFNVRNHDEAIIFINKAIEADSVFIEAFLLKSEILGEIRNHFERIKCLKKAISINVDFFPPALLDLALTEYIIARYDEAKIHVESFLSKKSYTEKEKKSADDLLPRCIFAITALKNPVPFNPVSISDSINTEFDEYWPYLTADDALLVFTRTLPMDYNAPLSGWNSQEDIFISEKIKGRWGKPVNMGNKINTADGNEGAECISSDGRYFLFTACNREDGKGSCDIYLSLKKNNVWAKPRNLGNPINTSYWETGPSLSSDCKTLFFVSSRPGGKGGMDIWMAQLNSQGTGFDTPVNLGDSINTAGDEMAPFIHPDGNTLYFASRGWNGMGGFDIFISRRDSSGGWSTPQNLGYPINTNNDENGMAVNAKGDLAIFASSRIKGKKRDLFSFNLLEKVKPIITNYVKGVVFDSVTKNKLKAKIELIDLETDKIVAELFSDEGNGEYLVCLPINKNYAFNCGKEKYMMFTENFSLKDMKDPTKPYIMDIPLQPIAIDKKAILKNVFYEFNSYALKKESRTELKKLIDFMKTNSTLKIEVSGHTDNVGTADYNQKLSEKRAKSVYDFLIEKGLTADRVSFKGYGFTQPVDTNDTEDGRAKNRRTEFKITGLN